jgi:hypothetical protein
MTRDVSNQEGLLRGVGQLMKVVDRVAVVAERVPGFRRLEDFVERSGLQKTIERFLGGEQGSPETRATLKQTVTESPIAPPPPEVLEPRQETKSERSPLLDLLAQPMNTENWPETAHTQVEAKLADLENARSQIEGLVLDGKRDEALKMAQELLRAMSELRAAQPDLNWGITNDARMKQLFSGTWKGNLDFFPDLSQSKGWTGDKEIDKFIFSATGALLPQVSADARKEMEELGIRFAPNVPVSCVEAANLVDKIRRRDELESVAYTRFVADRASSRVHPSSPYRAATGWSAVKGYGHSETWHRLGDVELTLDKTVREAAF